MRIVGRSATDTWWMPSRIGSANNPTHLVPVFNGTGGDPTHAVTVLASTTNAVQVTEYRRSGDDWIHDGTLARDAAVTLSQTMTAVTVLTAFAIENPVATSKRILFVVYNNASATPDALVIDSIDLSGGETLAAVAVTIAGANAPAATDLIAAVGCAFSTSRAGLIYHDDLYRADITGDESGFTFTFTDATVTAIDTSIDVDTTLAGGYSMYLVGTTVALINCVASNGTALSVVPMSMWTMTTAGVLIAEYLDLMLSGFQVTTVSPSFARIFAIGGSHAIANGITNSGAYLIRKIPAGLVAN